MDLPSQPTAFPSRKTPVLLSGGGGGAFSTAIAIVRLTWGVVCVCGMGWEGMGWDGEVERNRGKKEGRKEGRKGGRKKKKKKKKKKEEEERGWWLFVEFFWFRTKSFFCLHTQHY